ncbi:hypothetical protein E9993_00525 [Labilibacter sediminis]|nr:hypothetical protein E9993_00525 [Labilibacter sediminis]
MKNKIFYSSILAVVFLAWSCEKITTNGEFEVDNELMDVVVQGDTIPPIAPVSLEMIPNCDRSVTFSWDEVENRCTGYKLVEVDQVTGAEIIIADNIEALTYQLPDVLTVSEFRLYSKNPKNTSYTYASNVGISGGTPDAPTGVTATDAIGKSVKLSWDEMLYAESYEVWRGEQLIAGPILSLFYEDNEALDEVTEYTIKAVSVCGTSAGSMASGRAGSDADFPLYINFETSDLGSTLDPLGFVPDYGAAWDKGEGFSSINAHEQNTLAYGTQFGTHVQTGPAPGSTWQKARGMNLTLPTITLEVGVTYEISIDLKTPNPVYLELPIGNTVVDAMGGDDVWKTTTYQFTAEEVSPVIRIGQWYGPGGPRTHCYDNIVIKKL